MFVFSCRSRVITEHALRAMRTMALLLSVSFTICVVLATNKCGMFVSTVGAFSE